jgi:LPS export ABC transporter protein LptC
MKLVFLLFIGHFFLITSCTTEIEKVDALVSKNLDTRYDIGDTIKITYSDSGVTKLILESPMIEKSTSLNDPKEIFRKGIKITFMDSTGKTNAYLQADYAERIPFQSKMTTRGNVRFYNLQNDKIATSELIWDEAKNTLKTEKFVRITRPSARDTTYGIGFETDDKFDKIIIKRKIQSKLNADIIKT